MGTEADTGGKFSFERLAERSIISEAALRTLVSMPPKQQELFDVIKDTIKTVGPVILKTAPDVIGALKPIVISLLAQNPVQQLVPSGAAELYLSDPAAHDPGVWPRWELGEILRWKKQDKENFSNLETLVGMLCEVGPDYKFEGSDAEKYVMNHPLNGAKALGGGTLYYLGSWYNQGFQRLLQGTTEDRPFKKLDWRDVFGKGDIELARVPTPPGGWGKYIYNALCAGSVSVVTRSPGNVKKVMVDGRELTPANYAALIAQVLERFTANTYPRDSSAVPARLLQYWVDYFELAGNERNPDLA